MTDKPKIGDYNLLRTIGLGSQAKVKLGEHIKTGTKVAIKIMKKSKIDKDPDLQKKIQREMSLMRIFDHPHLLKLFDVLETETHLYLVLEYAKNGELFDYISTCGSLSAQLALKFFRQIVYGLDFLHTHALCHRDMKPENIFLDEYDNIKIGDFGFARWMKTNVAETQCGSPHYAAPEVIKGDGYDGRVSDVWSVGVIFYTLLCGRLPFVDESVHNLLIKIRTADFKMPEFPDPIKDLISRMLCVDVTQRITLKQIKQHEAFRLMMPEEYVFPSPLPPANITEPIDPASLNEGIMRVLKQIGFDDQELKAELMASHQTKAKQFLFLVLRRVSFDSLHWDGKEKPVVNLSIDPKTVINFDDPFVTNEKYQSRIPFIRSASVCETGTKHAVFVTEIQKYLTAHEYNWFYPHDLLILVSKREGTLDFFLRLDYIHEHQMCVKAFLSKGEETEFDSIVQELANLLKE